MNNVQLVESLTRIISEQSLIIDELYKLLSLHLSADEIRKLTVLDRIGEIAKLPS